MPKAYFVPTDDPRKKDWLNHLAGELPAHAATVGVGAAEVSSVQADALFFTWVMDAKTKYDAAAQQWTAFKNAARNGKAPATGPLPVAPVLAAAPPAVAPGIFLRVPALCARIKKHPGYTNAIGQALDIIGAEQTVDLANAKPVLTMTLQAGHPNAGWTKGDFHAVKIKVDRGNGVFVFLAVDTVPDYLDTFALPAPGASALWKYQAIYILNDEEVGQWSDVVSIAVTGQA